MDSCKTVTVLMLIRMQMIEGEPCQAGIWQGQKWFFICFQLAFLAKTGLMSCITYTMFTVALSCLKCHGNWEGCLRGIHLTAITAGSTGLHVSKLNTPPRLTTMDGENQP